MLPVHTNVKWDVLNGLYSEDFTTKRIRHNFLNKEAFDPFNLIFNVEARLR